MRALLIVDLQNGFCEGGSLPVRGGIAVARRIGQFVRKCGNTYDWIFATRDWHVDPGDHFKEWPIHCVAGTTDAELRQELPVNYVDHILNKGRRAAAYSGFEARNCRGDLLKLLREYDITELDVVGLATDYCVKATVLDARKHGFSVRVILDLCAAVAKDTEAAATLEMKNAGAVLISG